MKRTLKDKIALIEAMQENTDRLYHFYKESNDTSFVEESDNLLLESRVYDKILWILREDNNYIKEIEKIYMNK